MNKLGLFDIGIIALILIVVSGCAVLLALPSILISNQIDDYTAQGRDFLILDIHTGLGEYYLISPNYRILPGGGIEVNILKPSGIEYRVFSKYSGIRKY